MAFNQTNKSAILTADPMGLLVRVDDHPNRISADAVSIAPRL